MDCPRCHTPLDESLFSDVPMEMCGSCMGALVRQRDLIRLLDAMSAALAKEMSFDHEIEPVIDCPWPLPGTAFGLVNSSFAEIVPLS